MPDLEGKTLNRYKLQRLMGKGGMADVYLSYDAHFNREVAIKVFKREDESLLRRFIREAHLMDSLRNPRLMPVYDAGSTNLDGSNVYYIVMPCMKGGTLRDRIRNNPLPASEACRYLNDIAAALDYLHQQGIIHRDIKSSNVLLDDDNRCYLADFGIARAASDATQMTSTGNIMGTVDYLAPELVETNQRADARSDLYSLGVLLFEMITGVLPFRGENQIAVVAMHVGKRPPSPRSIVATIPPAVERVVYKALEKRPELRYESATRMAEAFCHAATAQSQLADPIWSQATFAVSNAYIQNPQHLVSVNDSLPPSATGSLPAASPTEIYSGQPTHPPSAAYTPEHIGKHRSSRTRAAIVTIIAVITLLALLIPSIYVAATHSFSLSSDNTSVLATTQAMQNLKATQSAANVLATQQTQIGTATAQAMATATIQAHATATQQALNATATSQAMGTATALANATATAAVIQTATMGSPLYSNPFNNPADPRQRAGWNITDNACSFQPDGYHAMATGNPTVCYLSPPSFQDFAAKVDIEFASGYSGGLFFRANSLSTASGYLFEIDNNGNYRLSSSADFSSSTTTLQGWTASSALTKGFHVKNTLEVIAQGSNLKLYANGIFLTALQDTSFNGGNLGFLANVNAQNPNADVVYTNLDVYQA
jgi:serine/threonine protein kinase